MSYSKYSGRILALGMTLHALSRKLFAQALLLPLLKSSNYASVSHPSMVLPTAEIASLKIIHSTSLVLVSKISRYARRFLRLLMGAQSSRDMQQDSIVINLFICNSHSGTRTNTQSSVSSVRIYFVSLASDTFGSYVSL
jgi:hypothetical protein